MWRHKFQNQTYVSNQAVFLHDQKVKTETKISWERNEILRWNKSIFHYFKRAFKCQKLSQTWECTFNHLLMRKPYACLWCKATRNVDKANKKIVQFNFVSFFIITGKSFYTKVLYIRLPILQLKELFLTLSFMRYDVF